MGTSKQSGIMFSIIAVAEYLTNEMNKENLLVA